MTNRGDKLVFSYGILFLAGAAAVLVSRTHAPDAPSFSQRDAVRSAATLDAMAASAESGTWVKVPTP